MKGATPLRPASDIGTQPAARLHGMEGTSDTPLTHIARALGLPEPRVCEIYSELCNAGRVSALTLEDGRVGFTFDGAATLFLTCLIDPPAGRAVCTADALATVTCKRVADAAKPLWPAPPPEDGGATILAAVEMLMRGTASAHSFSAGIDRGGVIATIRYGVPDGVTLAMFLGDDVMPQDEGSEVLIRSTAIRAAALPELAARMACVDLKAESEARN